LHDLKVGVWYAVSAWSIIGPMFFSRHHQFWMGIDSIILLWSSDRWRKMIQEFYAR
jgi:hypothetical protein